MYEYGELCKISESEAQAILFAQKKTNSKQRKRDTAIHVGQELVHVAYFLKVCNMIVFEKWPSRIFDGVTRLFGSYADSLLNVP